MSSAEKEIIASQQAIVEQIAKGRRKFSDVIFGAIGGSISIRGIDFSGMDFSGADLTRVKGLYGTTFGTANFRDIKVNPEVFRSANVDVTRIINLPDSLQALCLEQERAVRGTEGLGEIAATAEEAWHKEFEKARFRKGGDGHNRKHKRR